MHRILVDHEPVGRGVVLLRLPAHNEVNESGQVRGDRRGESGSGPVTYGSEEEASPCGNGAGGGREAMAALRRRRRRRKASAAAGLRSAVASAT